MRTILGGIANSVCMTIQSGLISREFSVQKILKLNELTFLKESVKKRRRWGRGSGSGRGKQSGFGHQKSRSTPRAFEGGQTPLYKRLPKIGFFNSSQKSFQILNLSKIQEFITMGRLIPSPDKMITMRDLLYSGIVSQVNDGIKILADGKSKFTSKIHLEVSAASSEAIKAIEASGGTVTCSYFNPLALRALIKPTKFLILPQRARPTPTLMEYYLNREKAGYLSPEIQIRNLKLFGSINSEKALREEHQRFMKMYRASKEAAICDNDGEVKGDKDEGDDDSNTSQKKQLI